MQTQRREHLLTGQACLARRVDAGLSRAELARRALVDITTLWRFESAHGASHMSRRRIEAALVDAELEFEGGAAASGLPL